MLRSEDQTSMDQSQNSQNPIPLQRRETVVYTCGAFDLFHVGHLNILEGAKALGDRLIVAVSTDELVGEYKGKKTTVPFEERIRIVSALRCVDCAIPQHERDKFAAWQKVGFDIWVVGDDWYGHEDYMSYKIRLEAVGVRTVFLPYTRHLSSTMRREMTRDLT